MVSDQRHIQYCSFYLLNYVNKHNCYRKYRQKSNYTDSENAECVYEYTTSVGSAVQQHFISNEQVKSSH